MKQTMENNRPVIRGILLMCAGLLVTPWLPAAELPPTEGRTNLALGQTVVFAPEPNYSLTQRNDTDATDLTDGELTKRADRHIWFDSTAVGWSYGGRVNLAVDLGRMARIDEVAVRLLGGSPQAGINFPGWIEAFVSDDGENYVKVAECSRWRPGDFQRFGVPDDAGKGWIHCLRFKDLAARGRWVGLRMYVTGLAATDELYVFDSPLAETPDGAAPGQPSDFSVTRPQPYFHKPNLELATNICLPVPIGVVIPGDQANSEPLEMTLELPPGIELCGGQLAGQESEQAKPETMPDGRRRYQFIGPAKSSTKTFGRLYFQASGWKDDQTGSLRYRFRHADWESPIVELPVHAVEVPRAPRLKRMMVGLGWWNASATAKWPGALDAWDQLGLNSFSLFAHWMREDNPDWKLVDEARRRGFSIVNIASPLHRMASHRAKTPEICDQFADGSVGDKLCVSYRGQHYKNEIQRFAAAMARARPHFASLDIEVWGWQGPVDCRKCTRCQKDFAASGMENWEAWQVAKGNEMWRDMVTAARAAIKEAGGGPEFEIGGYDFRAGGPYQSVWSVDDMYPQWMQSSQVSTYTCLYPYHLGLIGDEVREDRAHLPQSDVLPWLTPGDAGTFPGESFQWALLECYSNGARGVYFWSSRVWDSESLIAYNRVVRAIAPVEQVLVDGELVGDAARAEAPGRVSGIRRGEDMVLLVADYFRRTDGTVNLTLQVPARSEIRDLITGEVLSAGIQTGERLVPVPLGENQARLLHVHPLD
ncbi:MAG: hypothetical protein ISR77_14415 [Pirellulaceae bacterium]|nr:hypothetical protein [Pirellulaceae bacterium]